MIKKLINTQKKEIEDLLNNRFNIKKKSIEGFDSYTGLVVENTISLKTWESPLENYIANSFFKEIISNCNQALVLGLLGFNIAAFTNLRRCLENILVFIYYSEHNIEYQKKELDVTKRNFDKIENILNYIKDYPFTTKYPGGEKAKMDTLLKKVCDIWLNDYKELSNYVHSSNTKYLDLNVFLVDIKPTKEKLDLLAQTFTSITNIIHSLLIIFFYKEYHDLIANEKTLIKSNINDGNIKRNLKEYFKDI